MLAGREGRDLIEKRYETGRSQERRVQRKHVSTDLGVVQIPRGGQPTAEFDCKEVSLELQGEHMQKPLELYS